MQLKSNVLYTVHAVQVTVPVNCCARIGTANASSVWHWKVSFFSMADNPTPVCCGLTIMIKKHTTEKDFCTGE